MSAVARACRRRLVAFVAVALALAVALPVAAARRAPAKASYVVQLTAPPVASYRGGTQGIPATSPRRTGRRLDNRSQAVRAYRAFLAGRQRAALARLGADQPRVTYSYRTAFAGFAAQLTAEQVTKLRKAPEVARVSKDARWKTTSAASENVLLDNATFPDGAAYLDLPEGLWSRLGGAEGVAGSDVGAGAGVVVGDIDTGIQPGHPSFADDPDDPASPVDFYVGAAYPAVPGTWTGDCETGTGFLATDCNNKLIGARFFVDGFGEQNLGAGSFLSPRDDDGHGSHTASTAAGNFGVDPAIEGNVLGVNRISGIAPRARIAAYKVCWIGNNVTSPSGCTNSDSVAAIDAAVNDGVDVINYSIGATDSQVIGAVEVAFLGASDAGVVVSNSAGNAGPDPGTVGSPSGVPWLISVAASSLARTFESTATITNPNFTIKGASVTAAVTTATLLADAAGSALPNASSANAELCRAGTLDPAKVTGKVVLCRRGVNSRIDKSRQVLNAGGVGMILFNATDSQELVTDTHWVPSVHVSNTDGLRVKAAIVASGGTARVALTAGTAVAAPGAILAAFSSRGPQTAVPDIARPDVTAPGVNILAAAANQPAPNSELKPGNLFQSISGTSMSSPHVAGAAALLTQLHPTFSSAALKSSLMTTANPDVKRENGTTPADPFDAGSGQIDPTAAADPGLVVDTTTDDYISYLADVAPEAVTGGPTIKPADLNLPSISNASLAGIASTSRTFTSVDSVAQTWTVDVQGVDGISVTPSVDGFTIKPGQTQELGLDFQVNDAPVDQYAFGALVLTNGSRTVRLPISLQPIPVAAADTIEVTTDQPSGTQAIPVQAGFAGQLSGLGYGLAAPDVRAGETITSSPSGGPVPDGSAPGTTIYPVEVPDPSQLLAARLSNVDGGDTNTDLDMYLYKDGNGDGAFTNNEIVAQSASGSSDEHIELTLPDPGLYGVAIVGFTTNVPSSVYDLTTWVVSDTAPDDLGSGPGIAVTGDPAAVNPGTQLDLDLDWAAVKSKGLYLGVATFHDSATPTAANRRVLSLVELDKTVDTPDAGGAPPSGATPPAAGTPPAGAKPPAAARLRLRLLSARLRGRTVTLRLRASRSARIRPTVRRGSRKVASGSPRRVTTSTRVLRVRVNRRIRRGRTYTVRIAAYSGTRVEAAASVRMRVR